MTCRLLAAGEKKIFLSSFDAERTFVESIYKKYGVFFLLPHKDDEPETVERSQWGGTKAISEYLSKTFFSEIKRMRIDRKGHSLCSAFSAGREREKERNDFCNIHEQENGRSTMLLNKLAFEKRRRRRTLFALFLFPWGVKAAASIAVVGTVE